MSETSHDRPIHAPSPTVGQRPVPPPVAPPVIAPPVSAPPKAPPQPPPPLSPRVATPQQAAQLPQPQPVAPTTVYRPHSISATSPVAPVTEYRPGKRGRKKKLNIFVSAGSRLAEKWKQARRMPAWLVSFIFHLLLLLILALIPIPGMGGSAITLFLGGDSAGIADFELSGGSPNETEMDQPQAMQISQTETDLSRMLVTAAPSLMEQPKVSTTEITNMLRIEDANANFGESITAAISNGLRGRTGDFKGDMLRRGGGSAETEDAVEMGLEWLARQQRSDGSWSLRGPYSDGATAENTVAATGMALNAFLGAGYHHKEGKYHGNVLRGIKYLLSLQNKEGFFTTGKEERDQRAYAQAIATITILEALGLSNDYELLEAARKAVKYAEWAQSKFKGWRYHPREDADVSVTGWFVMALETAKLVGLEVNEDKLQSVNDYLDSVGHRDNSAYAYTNLHQPDLSMTAEGLLCRIWLGWPKSHPALLEGVQELSTHIPHERDVSQSVYYWYYATQVLHHFGGEPWNIWNQEMKRALPAMQEKDGDEKGSWSPLRDIYGSAGGRLYTTCLSIYCLEVYYRHLAIYDTE